MSDIETKIQAANLTAPRVTPDDINAAVIDTEIVTHISQGGQVLRWAILTCANGFAVVGDPSVAVSPENDRAEIGIEVAIENSKQRLWPLLGFALKDRLHRRETAGQAPRAAQQGTDPFPYG
jgi:hypothetical protein